MQSALPCSLNATRSAGSSGGLGGEDALFLAAYLDASLAVREKQNFELQVTFTFSARMRYAYTTSYKRIPFWLISSYLILCSAYRRGRSSQVVCEIDGLSGLFIVRETDGLSAS